MKQLTLSAEQRNNLLTLAKYYFPEYELIDFHSILYDNLVFFKKDGKRSGDFFINWFHFCLTELPKRIFGEALSSSHCLGNISKALDNAAYMISHLHIHPVVFLFEHYQELIKNKK